MTRDAWLFQRALLASLAFHALLLTLFFTLPGGGPAEPVQIYTVRIMEAPSRPQARELTLSTGAISALKLESPSLNADAPPLAPPDQAEVPDVERLPQTAAPSPTPAAPSLTPPTATPVPAQPGVQTPTAPPPLPGLPAAPAAKAPTRPPAAPPSSEAQVLAPPQATDTEPQRATPMEQLRSKVRSLNLQAEPAPSATPGTETTPVPSRERNVLSLRMYTNRVREAVKEQYSFPGNFDASLRARVRVVLNRDGTVSRTELLESSGNDRFDRLVCLAAFNHAKIPAVPRNIEGDGDTLTLTFTCSP